MASGLGNDCSGSDSDFRKVTNLQPSTFWTSWRRYFVRGLHVVVALMVSGFIAQVVVWAIVGSLSAISRGGEGLNGAIAEIIVPVACFVFVGLPLFGFLFSKAYSTTEPADDQSERIATPKGSGSFSG